MFNKIKHCCALEKFSIQHMQIGKYKLWNCRLSCNNDLYKLFNNTLLRIGLKASYWTWLLCISEPMFSHYFQSQKTWNKYVIFHKSLCITKYGTWKYSRVQNSPWYQIIYIAGGTTLYLFHLWLLIFLVKDKQNAFYFSKSISCLWMLQNEKTCAKILLQISRGKLSIDRNVLQMQAQENQWGFTGWRIY